MEVETGTAAGAGTVEFVGGLPCDGPEADTTPTGNVAIKGAGVGLAIASGAAIAAANGFATNRIPSATTSPLAPLSLRATVTLPLLMLKVPRSVQRTPP